MTIDKFGRHLSQPMHSPMDHEYFSQTPISIIDRIIKNLYYYNVILTFESTAFQENSKKYLISNIKTCFVVPYESAVIQSVETGYPADIITIINGDEYTLPELLNKNLFHGDNISFQEKDPQSTNNNLFLELFIRVPLTFHI